MPRYANTLDWICVDERQLRVLNVAPRPPLQARAQTPQPHICTSNVPVPARRRRATASLTAALLPRYRLAMSTGRRAAWPYCIRLQALLFRTPTVAGLVGAVQTTFGCRR